MGSNERDGAERQEGCSHAPAREWGQIEEVHHGDRTSLVQSKIVEVHYESQTHAMYYYPGCRYGSVRFAPDTATVSYSIFASPAGLTDLDGSQDAYLYACEAAHHFADGDIYAYADEGAHRYADGDACICRGAHDRRLH
jgi:hypothetical protein